MAHLQDYTGADEPSTPFTEYHSHGITIVHYSHVLELEIDHDPASQISQQGKSNSTNNSAYDTETFEDRGE